MKNTTSSLLSIIALITILCGSATAQKRIPQIHLIETGEFHGGEITAKSGERWLGLFPTSGGFSLLPATLKVDMVNDPIVDENPKVKTGKKVSVNRARKPLFLLKGADFLRANAVRTIFTGDENNLVNGQSVDLRLGGKNYNLKVVSNDPTPVNHVVANSKLILSSGAKSQVIFSVEVPDDGAWSLLWAGDLDGDGKLDLYMDLHNKYNSSERRLFLSSPASRGNLVKEVAEFRTVGC
ncbi:MAG TPA: hypothetical protein VEX70_10790 [Pyrinomonadaceae bacterium]|nr:hypothetical protein [Pyrinomonadaceae bacterium]